MQQHCLLTSNNGSPSLTNPTGLLYKPHPTSALSAQKTCLFSFFPSKMLTFLALCFQKVLSGENLDFVESKSSSKFMYRDELSKKKIPSNQKKYYGDYLSSSTPLLKVKDSERDPKISSSARGFDGKAGTTVARVKLKMTKEEAARLLSKCKDGGILDFKDVARELVHLPPDRVIVVSSFTATNSVLDGIQKSVRL
ncbi:hypothetical protein ERO13_A08G103450v2 [Gossypium hirsutum]|nr:hypothetical protein ERO13_A08G103450v2 [Gossypium hirsutum]